MTGCCFRCGVEGPVELDHPTGTVNGRHLHPEFTVPLCRECHRFRSIVDQRVGVEGGLLLSPWLVTRRLSAWFACLAIVGRDVTFGPETLTNLAAVLEGVAAWLDDGERVA